MRDKVIELHGLRQEQEANDQKLRESRAAWEVDNAELLDKQAELRGDVAALESIVWAERLIVYDGRDKSKIFGVGVREETALYYIHQDAFNWAVEHKLCLRLDTKPFEKIAREGEIDFVTIEKHPKATIARDLSPYLEDGDEA